MNLLEQVRRTSQYVAQQARFVRINRAYVPTYATTLPLFQPQPMLFEAAHHYCSSDVEEMAGFVLTLDTINFGSGFFPLLHKPAGRSGYETIAGALTQAYHTRGMLEPLYLTQLTAQECASIFGQDLSVTPIAHLMQLFAQALQHLGQYVLDQFGGRFVQLVEAVAGSGERLVQLLITMPLFNDVASYQGHTVAFYKRAQLAVADLSLALRQAGLGAFDDLDRLTIFADNEVPHVLRVDGILTYSTELAEWIDRGVLLEAGSAEEVEIRACAVYAAELITSSLQEAGHMITPRHLDYVLWNRGQSPSYQQVRQPHRTYTPYY